MGEGIGESELNGETGTRIRLIDKEVKGVDSRDKVKRNGRIDQLF